MMRARIAVAKLAMNTLRYFLPPALLAVAAPASALHQHAEHILSDSAGMAGG
jgi:hypothetical protein